jgi:hypothetical protein
MDAQQDACCKLSEVWCAACCKSQLSLRRVSRHAEGQAGRVPEQSVAWASAASVVWMAIKLTLGADVLHDRM